jgi:hypothetical protein
LGTIRSGQWVVRDGRHLNEQIATDFKKLVSKR